MEGYEGQEPKEDNHKDSNSTNTNSQLDKKVEPRQPQSSDMGDENLDIENDEVMSPTIISKMPN